MIVRNITNNRIQSRPELVWIVVAILLFSSLAVGSVGTASGLNLVLLAVCVAVFILCVFVRYPHIPLSISLVGIQFYPLVAKSIGISTSPNLTAGLFIFLVLGYLPPLLYRDRSSILHLLWRKEVGVLVVFVVWMLSNWIALAYDNPIGTKRLFGFAPTLMIAPFLAGLLLTEAQLKQLAWSIVVLGVISMLLILNQYIINGQPLTNLAVNTRVSIEETTNHLRVAYANGLAAVIFFVLISSQRDLRHKKLWFYGMIGTFVLAVFLILAAGTRGPLLAILASVLTVLAVSGKLKKMRSLSAVFVVLFVLLGLTSFLPDWIIERYLQFGGLFTGNVSDEFLIALSSNRWATWRFALNLWWASPIWGIGIGNVEGGVLGKFVHNFMLETLVELGIVGLFILVTILLMLVKGIYHLIQIASQSTSTQIIIAFVVYSFINMSFSGILQIQSVFWLSCGLGLSTLMSASLKDNHLSGAGYIKNRISNPANVQSDKFVL